MIRPLDSIRPAGAFKPLWSLRAFKSFGPTDRFGPHTMRCVLRPGERFRSFAPLNLVRCFYRAVTLLHPILISHAVAGTAIGGHIRFVTAQSLGAGGCCRVSAFG